MAVPGTDDTQNPPSPSPSARPSWETARSAAPPRRPAPAQPAAPPDAAPYYQSAPAPVPVATAPAYQAPVYQPAQMATDVKYDLAGNPIASSAATQYGAPPPVPSGYPAGTAASWPPGPSSYGGSQSSIGNGTDRVSKLRWNWGAFLHPFLWSIFNGLAPFAITLAVLDVLSVAVPNPYSHVPQAASVGIAYYLGFKGNELAWNTERFGGDYDEFIRVQRVWMIWSLALLGVGLLIVLCSAGLILGVITGAAKQGHRLF